MLTGKELYEKWAANMFEQGVACDTWVELETSDQGAWDALASDMYMTRENAVEIAKEAAVMFPENWPYLSAAKQDPTWNPHEWVVQAILRGANGAFEE